MATVTEPKKFNHAETQRSVKHPLQLVRKYIRRYIILEGVALTLLCASLIFWLGLAFDYGMFLFDFERLNVFGIDWLLEFNEVDPTGFSSLACRLIVLTVIVVGLLALGFIKVVWRWMREFNDRAIALVLERRFHKQLGDRLITAVEMKDPKLSEKYGYSQAMIEKTISEAVEILKKLPVSDVFNWRRLIGLWCLVGASTLGVLLVTMLAVCGGSFFVRESPMMPLEFAWKFYDVGSIWTERNVLMMSTYWPRRAHLEVERFQPSMNDANDMRVPRDEQNKPELQVRAFEWVLADRDRVKAPYGWRALRWQDLSDHKLVDPALLAKITIPVEFEHWQLDTDELEPNLVAALFTDEIKGRSSGEVRAYFSLPHVRQKIALRHPKDKQELDDWLDWTTWTVDKIGLQKENTKARTPLRDLNNEATNYSAHLDEVFAQLNEHAASPSMSRTIRKLEIPKVVAVTLRGSETQFPDDPAIDPGNKFRVSLDKLAGSPRFKLRARAENYFTPVKMITLVASPATKEISIDKEEPAYQYLRLVGPDQMALRGLKHVTERVAISTTGDTNTFELPLGSRLVIHVRTDRKLREERPVISTNPPLPDPNFAAFNGAIAIDGDREGFSLELTNIIRMHDFMVEFYDEDNIRGKRRFKVLRTLDAEPHVGNLSVFSYLPRKPKFKAPAPADKEKDKDKDKDKEEHVRDLREQNELANAYIITPDAKIPLECLVKDEYGLVQVGYQFKHRKVDFELIAQGGKKLPSLQIDQVTRRYHAAMIASNFQFWPGNPLAWNLGPTYVAATADRVQKDLRLAQRYREDYIPAKGFEDLLARRASEMIRPEALKQKLTGGRGARAWEFDFKDDPGFDLQKFTPEFKQTDAEGGQMHYFLQIAVQATDNDVETGAEYRHPIGQIGGGERSILRGNTKRNANGYLNFIVVSENELLSQIALEEEMLFEKLEIAKEKVDLGITSLLEQQSKTQNKNSDLDQIINRMNEIRTALGTAGNNVREAHQAYENILKEMDVNRVKAERVKKIQDAIITRLDTIVVKDMSDQRNPNNTGSFVRAEEAFQKAHQLLEEENAAKRPPDAAAHRENMLDAHRQMVRLSDDIRLVLDAMSEGIVESKAIALLTLIEQIQRGHSQYFNNVLRENTEKAIKGLLDDEDDDKTKGKGKGIPKKTSQLRTAPNLLSASSTNRRQPLTLSASEGMSRYQAIAHPLASNLSSPRWRSGLVEQTANFKLGLNQRLC